MSGHVISCPNCKGRMELLEGRYFCVLCGWQGSKHDVDAETVIMNTLKDIGGSIQK